MGYIILEMKFNKPDKNQCSSLVVEVNLCGRTLSVGGGSYEPI